jgi:hypothetical protein
LVDGNSIEVKNDGTTIGEIDITKLENQTSRETKHPS